MSEALPANPTDWTSLNATSDEMFLRTVIDNPWIPWKPHQKQIAFLTCPLEECLFGGAAGGAKTVAILMAAAQFVEHGNYNALLCRKTLPMLELPGGLISLSKSWWTNTDAEWSEQKKCWRFPSGALIQFGYLDVENDMYRYQGSEWDFCCAGDTGVRMADGSIKRIDKIRVGDLVSTLDGPRRVTRTHEVRKKQAAKVDVFVGETFIGSQVQSMNHRVLLGEAWASLDMFDESRPSVTFAPKASPDVCRFSKSSLPRCPSCGRHHATGLEDQTHTGELSQSLRDRQFVSADVAYMEQPSLGSENESSSSTLCTLSRPSLDSDASLEIVAPDLSSPEPGSPPSASCYANPNVRDGALLEGSRDCCSMDSRRYGEQPRLWSKDARLCLRQPVDVEAQSPSNFETDGTDGTRQYSPLRESGYVHPYTKVQHQTQDELSVASLFFTPVGIVDLYDITVEGASHYITETGLINSNCGFDELTQFPENMYLYLFSRLRRRIDSLIPPRVRCTANPGGLGHEWVKERFINNRIGHFIPSRLEDNPSLDRVEYESKLQKLDAVTRAQLRNGDWHVRPDGNLFKRAWFDKKIVELRDVPEMVQTVRFWDLAATEEDEGNDPDFTAGVKMGLDRFGNFYIFDNEEFRMTPAGGDERIKQIAHADGRAVEVAIEQEPGSSGKRVIDHFVRTVLRGFSVRGIRSTGDKITRAKPFSAACENGLVFLVRGNWIANFIDRCMSFGIKGTHDDTVDAAAGAHRQLTQDEAPWTPEEMEEVFNGPAYDLDSQSLRPNGFTDSEI